jgi:hypothetical protein
VNALGTLATSISDYGYLADTGNYPVTYISGWLDANIGQFNALTNNSVTITSTGAFSPALDAVENSIFSSIFEVNYYNKASRDALRNLTYGTAATDWVSIKEGDTSIQRVNKNSVARSFYEFSKDSQARLNQMLSKYLIGKSSPVQVAGDDGLAILP